MELLWEILRARDDLDILSNLSVEFSRLVQLYSLNGQVVLVDLSYLHREPLRKASIVYVCRR